MSLVLPSDRYAHAHTNKHTYTHIHTRCIYKHMYTNTQNAARHTGAMQVLVDMLKNSDTHTEMLEIAAAAIRNLCGNSLENSEVCWCICVTSYRVGYICVYIYIYLYIYIYIYLSMGAVCVRVISTVCCMCVGIDA